MAGSLTPPRSDPELSGARDKGQSGHEPGLGSDRALDWDLWNALLNDSAPAHLRVALIPDGQRSACVSTLLEALPPGATYVRPMRDGQVWRGRFTHAQRLSAIGLLGALKDRRAVRPLRRQLGDPSNHVRIAIVMALGWIGGPAAIEALAQLLHHLHEPTRLEAVRWLGWSRDRLAREPLARALQDPALSVRVTAAKALARSDDPRAFGPLVDALWQCKGREEEQVLDELRRFDLPRTVQVLIQARGRAGSARHDAATRALRRLGTPAALAALEPYDHRYTAHFDDPPSNEDGAE